MLRHRLDLLLALGLLPATALAQTSSSPPSLLPFLPKNTIMAVAAPDLNASMGEFSQMPLARMWHEEEVQAFLGDAKEMVAQQIEQAMAQAREQFKQGQFPVDPDKLMSLRVRGGTFALTRLDIAQSDFGPMPEVGLMLHVDFGASAKQWFELIQMGLGMLAQQAGDELERSEWSVGDVKVVTMTPTQPPGIKMSLNFAMTPTGIVFSTFKDELKSTLENMLANQPVLTASDAYKASASQVPSKGSEAEMFMRMAPMLDFAVKALEVAVENEPDMAMIDPAGVGRALDALGLRSIHSMVATSSYVNGKAVSKSYVVAPAPERKGLLAGATKNLDTGFLKWVPKDAVGFSAMTMAPMSIYDALVAALKAYDDKVAEQAMAQLGQIEQQIGFSLRDDLFGALGDTMITWSMPMASIASPPETAVLMKVKDSQKIIKVVKAIAQMTEGAISIDEAERRGVKTYQLRINFDPTGGMGANPLDALSPSFAFKNDFMVLGFSPGDIRRVFERMDRTEDDPKNDIRGNKEFAAYLGTIPENVQSLSFTDWKANFESYYQVATSLLAFVPMNEDVPLDMSMLPEASTLTKHLFGSLSYAKADGNGIEQTSIGPFGAEAVLIAVVAVAAIAGAATTMGGF